MFLKLNTSFHFCCFCCFCFDQDKIEFCLSSTANFCLNQSYPVFPLSTQVLKKSKDQESQQPESRSLKLPADMAADKISSYGRGGAGTRTLYALSNRTVATQRLRIEANPSCVQETSAPPRTSRHLTLSPRPSKATCTPPAAAAKATWRKTTLTGPNSPARGKT